MNFSKSQIVSKPFSKKWMGGLSEFEVRDFLHVLAEQIRHLKQENLMLKKDLKEREDLIKDYRDREHILKESLANAEAWAQKIKQDAESHRQLILEKAQTDSESLIESARQSLQAVYNDIADLKRLQIQFKTGLKAALQVQLELLEKDSLFNPAVLNDFQPKEKLESQTDKPRGFDRGGGQPKEKLENQTESAPQMEFESKDAEALVPDSNSESSEQEDPSSKIHSLKLSLNALNKDFY